MMKEENHNMYFLRQEGRFHEKGVRSLCVINCKDLIVTGDYDGNVVVWGNLGGSSYVPGVVVSAHKGAVHCLCDGGEDVEGNPTVFSGGADRLIGRMDLQGNKKQTFIVRATIDGCSLISFSGTHGSRQQCRDRGVANFECFGEWELGCYREGLEFGVWSVSIHPLWAPIRR